MTEDERPAIEQLPARLCGGGVTGKDYVGYFLNEHGEELVFAQSRGEETARLRHSDADRQMFRVGDHSVRVGSAMDGVVTVGDLTIDRAEATWLSSCLAASRHLRQKRG